MDRFWILIGLVIIIVVFAGCIGSNGPEESNETGETPEDGTDDRGINETEDTDDEEQDIEDGELAGDPEKAMQECEPGTTRTEAFPGSGGNTESLTVTIQGVEQRNGTEFCKATMDYSQVDIGETQTDFFRNRTPETMEVWRSLEESDGSERGIMELYDTNDTIMLSMNITDGETEMRFYDENGEEMNTSNPNP